MDTKVCLFTASRRACFGSLASGCSLSIPRCVLIPAASFSRIGKVGSQLGELRGMVFFRGRGLFWSNVPAGCDYGCCKQNQNAIGEYCFIFFRHKSSPLRLRYSLYLDIVFSISAKYERVICLSQSFLTAVQIYAENEHFYAAWSDITWELTVNLHFEAVNPPRIKRIFAKSSCPLRFVSQGPPDCFL